jgi:uncharacterized protein YydD (DUF2326 family)
MTILEQIDVTSKRSEPPVWVSKLALFESLDPLTPIREPIRFHTGLNIVWGVENEANDEKFEPGHGVGKTTLCRLVRYCLGEPTYGQWHAAREILNTFPDGHVAAEVYIQGRRWAVLRPFNKTRADRAQADATITELLANPPLKESFRDYQSQLASTCLSGLRTDGVLTGGASIDWLHLLALCSRDQEARYQSLWQWRSPRSDSVPRNIQKDDAHLTLRSVLGLLPDEETTLQKKLAKYDSELTQVEKDIAERLREPEYWTRHYRQTLERDFKIKDAMTVSTLDTNDLFGLPKLVERAVDVLNGKQAKRQAKLKELDRMIGLTAASLQEPAELQEQQRVAATVTDSGSDTLAQALDELRQVRQLIRDAEHSLCKYGQVSIGSCSHAQQQLVELDQQIKERSQAVSSTVAKRDRVSTKLREFAHRKNQLIETLTKELEQLQRQRRSIESKRQSTQNTIKALNKAMEDLLRWETLRTGKEPDSELAQLQKRKKGLETRQSTAKEQLTALLASQDQSLAKLRTVYEALARNTLSTEFNGRVQLTGEGLEFRVFRGENLSGEAFETLSILLADIAVLLMGSLGSASHPGILIHDSPREADLGGHIYRRLLLSVSDVAIELAVDDTVPFQQIVTTTTPPPTTLKKKTTTCLKLGGEEGQLFGRQLHAESAFQQPLQFDDVDGQ